MAQEQLKSRETVEVAKKKARSNGASGDVTDARAAAGADDDVIPQRRQTSFARFMRDILIIAVLLGGGMYAYRKHIMTKEQVGGLSLQAGDKLSKDDLQSLKEAEETYKKILALDGDNERGLVGLAETYFHQSQHGLPTRDQSEQYLKRAIEEKSERPERYATQAYLLTTSGQAAAAERLVKDALDRGMGSSKLAHAYGLALLEQGNYAEASRLIRTALDTEFSGVRYALSLAEVTHRQGEERSTASNLRKVLGSGMNPKHEIALAWLAAISAKNYGNITQPAKYIQDVQARKDKIGPRAQALLAWAEGELALAMGNAAGAAEKAEEAISKLKTYPPFFDLKARTLLAMKKPKDAMAVYEQAVAMKPEYRGIKRDLIVLKSDRKDDGALALIDELQKAFPGTTGDCEIMRGEHYLKKGDLEQAKAAFTRAADIGDKPADILFGLARVTFLEEKKKTSKADLERVAEAFQSTIEKKAVYPEVHEYMAQISLWNFDVAGANNSYIEAETQYKKQNRPVPVLVDFFDRVTDAFKGVEDKRARKDAEKNVGDWKKRKEAYMAGVITGEGAQ